MVLLGPPTISAGYAGRKRAAGAKRRNPLLCGLGTRSKDQDMAKGQKKSNKEIRKPKKEKPKANAAGSSAKGLGPKQSDF